MVTGVMIARLRNASMTSTSNPFTFRFTYALRFRRSFLLAVVLLSSARVSPAAGTRQWDGGAGGLDANWTSAGNWTNNTAPINGDSLVFASGIAKLVVTNNFAANTDFGSISIHDDYTLNGNAVDITNFIETVGSAATVNLNLRLLRDTVFSATVNGLLQQNGTINLNSFDATFDGLSGSHEVNGSITDSAAASSHVIVTGSTTGPPFNIGGNVVVLSGTNNCPGGTLVTNIGTYVVHGVSTGLVSVASTATLSGSGSVGPVTLAGTLSPLAISGTGARLKVGGACVFTSTATNVFGLSGTSAGVTYDQLQCSNTVTLGSARLQISRDPSFIPAISNVFTIISKVSSGAVSGTYLGLPQGASTTVGGVTYLISYTNGGNDVALIVTNLDAPLVTRTWDGGGGNNNWSTAANWDAAIVASNHLIFPRAAGDAICTNDLAADTVFSTLRFTGTANTNNYPLLRGSSIRLLSGIFATNLGSSGSVVLEMPVKLAASQTFTNGSTNTDIELRSNLVVHPFTLTVRGPGTFRTSGTVTATNNANLVLVNGGHLVVNGTVSGNVSVTSSGDLSGNGAVGAVTVNASSLSPGDGSTGILLVNGSLTLNSSSAANFDLVTSVAGSGYDQIIVSNANVNLGSCALNLSLPPDMAEVVGTSFTLIKLTNPTNTITGTFAGLPEGSEVDAAPLRFRVSYAGGAGHDVVLTIIGALPSGNLVSGIATIDQGDTLFIKGPPNSTAFITNNHPAGYSLDQIVVVDEPLVQGGVSAVSLRGNALRLERGIMATNNQPGDIVTVSIQTPLVLNNDQTFSNSLPGQMLFGDINLDGHALTIDGFNSFPDGTRGIVVTGLLSGASSTSRLIKNTPYDLTLQPVGGVDTYQGSTLVSTGRLNLAGNLVSSIILKPQATLSATGMVGGILSTSGIVNAGVLESTGPVVLDSGSQLHVNLAPVPGGAAASLLTCDSTLNLGGSTLFLSSLFGTLADTNYTIISKVSAGPVVGAFAGLPPNTDFITNGHHFRISYTAGDGNDVVIFTTNNPPVITQVSDKTIFEQTLWTQQITASDADPADQLSYSLDPGSPTNATIGAASGLISWTPAEDQGPASFTFNVRVTDTGNPPKSSLMSFHVSVLDSNLPPVITATPTVTGNELTLISFNVSAADPDTPSDTLSYQLLQGPAGLAITAVTATNATMTWTPTEAQGPSTNTVLFRVVEQASGLSTTQSLSVVAQEVNVPPVFQPIAGTNVLSGTLVQRPLIASDSDIPANPLTFQLLSPPAGAAIVTNGLFQWTPSATQVGQFTLKIRCFDTNPAAITSRSLSVTQQFLVNVGILRVVTNTNDSGPGSLRQAITEVNTNSGGGEIRFNIAGSGAQRISPSTVLPGLARPTLINGYTQPNARPNQLTNGSDAVILIEISGENVSGGTGLDVGSAAGGSTIRGLCINRFTNGVAINTGCSSCGGFGNTASIAIEGCFIGTDPTGTLPFPNNLGIMFEQTHDSRIGGPDISQRNLISANLFDAIVPVQGFDGANVFNLTIQNNLIGCDSTGTNALGNGDLGITAPTGGVGGPGFSAHGCFIADNVLAGNAHGGILFGGSNNTFVRNKIGVGADGHTVLANGGPGLELFGFGQQVGTVNAADGNLIAFNNGPAVRIDDGTGHSVLGNSIFHNAGLAIDLGGPGVTPNDPGDTDTGANDLQNFPVLSAANSSPGGGTTIGGSLNSSNSSVYRIEFFYTQDFQPSGLPQTGAFLAATNVLTDAAGNVSFSINLGTNLPAGLITATATDANGSTSEPSAGATITATSTPPTLTIQTLGSQVRVLWSNSVSGFALQTNVDAGNANGWNSVSGSPGNDGQNFFFDFPVGGSALFFRLRSQ
jgi:hypothetical protein